MMVTCMYCDRQPGVTEAELKRMKALLGFEIVMDENGDRYVLCDKCFDDERSEEGRLYYCDNCSHLTDWTKEQEPSGFKFCHKCNEEADDRAARLSMLSEEY